MGAGLQQEFFFLSSRAQRLAERAGSEGLRRWGRKDLGKDWMQGPGRGPDRRRPRRGAVKGAGVGKNKPTRDWLRLLRVLKCKGLVTGVIAA